ncbi:MAG: aminopeptidase P family protein [Mycolicibacterium sp.]|nr:aminopeptidase P family protein [Mycolicibacterium sp.]
MVSRFSADVYGRRLRDAAATAGAAGLAGLVVTPGYDLRYLIGSRAQTFERLTALVLPPVGTPTVVVPRLELAALKESAVMELGLGVADWVDGEDPYRLVVDALGGAPAAVAGLSPPATVAGLSPPATVAVTDSMPALHLLPLAGLLGVTPVLATDVLRQLRMIKDAAEIDALRKAGAAIDRVHTRVPEFLAPGRTEADVAADIAEAIVAEGHSEVAFVIVGSGPHGADPHHECSDRVLQAGDVVVVDIGGAYEPGYNSDCTRTYSLGEPGPQVAQQYSVLQRAQQAAVAVVRPGVTAEQVDAAAREVLARAGLAEVFVHRTGHGIGLSVHEEPYIVAGNALPLQEGMVFSVEPGIYFRGRWGARIEDIVVVTAHGAESVNHRPHELTVVPPG